MFNWRNYLFGLLAVIVNGFANGVILILVDPLTFNLETGLSKLLTAAALSGVWAAANYLKQPFPLK